MNANHGQISLPTLRLVCAALILGQLVFAGVVAFLLQSAGGDGGLGNVELDILPTLAAGFAVAVVPVAFLIRGARFGRLAELEGDARLQAYAVTVILFMALLEGASLFNLVAWLVTGDAVPALPVVVVLVAISVAAFPSRTQYENLGR